MKIVVATSLTATATANYMVTALRKAEHTLLVFSDVASPLADHRVKGAFDIAEVCSQSNFSPDLMLFIEGGTMGVLPVGLEKLTCITAWYGIDTHIDYAKHLRIGRLFDITFVAQKEYVEKLHADGLRQVFWLPLAFAPELMPSQMQNRTIDIAHVGSSNVAGNPERHQLLEMLKHEFSSTRFGPATPEEMGRIYPSAKIVFNKSVNNDINMRYFEAAGAGAVLVTDLIVNNGIDDLFEKGRHYLVYQDEKSLLETIRYLLSDPAHCQAIGDAARRHVLEHHTYRHRIISLLETITKSRSLNKPLPPDYFAACLSLNLLEGALSAAAQSFELATPGRYRKYVGHFLAAALRLLGRFVGVAERTRALFHSRTTP